MSSLHHHFKEDSQKRRTLQTPKGFSVWLAMIANFEIQTLNFRGFILKNSVVMGSYKILFLDLFRDLF